MRFIHMADVHLGAEPERGTSLGKLRKKEIWKAFQDIIELCEREQIQLLMIPGDLFHGQPQLQDVKKVDSLFRRLTRTRVVMIAGNHDCLLDESHYYDVKFPENVSFLMNNQPDSVYLPELNVEVFGLSYEKEHISEARYDEIKIQDSSRINILLAHGNIRTEESGSSDKSIPIHRTALEKAGFDYCALGHLHTRFYISNRIAYSGGLEPFERKETGPKGYICGEIIKDGCGPSLIQWKFVPNAKREYVVLEYKVTEDDTEGILCEAIFEEMKSRGLQNMYCLNLTGTKPIEPRLQIEKIREIICGLGGLLVEVKEQLSI